MSESARYGFARKVLLRAEAACDLCWVSYKIKYAPWAWARENLQPTNGRVDRLAVTEIEQAAYSAAARLPFTVLCVPVTVTAMRMLKRRRIAAKSDWTPPGVRGDRGHLRLDGP
jgi:hypothetical protein